MNHIVWVALAKSGLHFPNDRRRAEQMTPVRENLSAAQVGLGLPSVRVAIVAVVVVVPLVVLGVVQILSEESAWASRRAFGVVG